MVGGKGDGLGQAPPPGREQEEGTEADQVEAAPAEGQDLDAHTQERRHAGPARLDRAHRANAPTAHRGITLLRDHHDRQEGLRHGEGARPELQQDERLGIERTGGRPGEERRGEDGPEQHRAATDPIGHQGDETGRERAQAHQRAQDPEGRLRDRQVGLDLLEGEGQQREVVHLEKRGHRHEPQHPPLAAREGGGPPEKGGQPHPGGPHGPVAVGGQSVAGRLCLV
jgi:hypothetical protein